MTYPLELNKKIRSGSPNWKISFGAQIVAYPFVISNIQGYVDNEINLNADKSCRQTCSDFPITKNYGCSKDTLCEDYQHIDQSSIQCKGTIYNCDFVEDDLTICPVLGYSASTTVTKLNFETYCFWWFILICLRFMHINLFLVGTKVEHTPIWLHRIFKWENIWEKRGLLTNGKSNFWYSFCQYYHQHSNWFMVVCLFRQSHGQDGLLSVQIASATVTSIVQNRIDTLVCMTSLRIWMKTGECSGSCETCANFRLCSWFLFIIVVFSIVILSSFLFRWLERHRIVTGIAITKRNRMFQFLIGESTLLPYGKLNTTITHENGEFNVNNRYLGHPEFR